MKTFAKLQDLQAQVGQEIGVSEWIGVDQKRIDQFAQATGDHQWIHIDPVKAAAGPFGKTIAHGFLVLSMLAKLSASADLQLQGATMGMNYGFDKVRMTNPVRSGSRIRGRFVLKDIVERAPGQWLTTMAVAVEVEGQSKPAIVAEWLGLQFVGQEGA